MFLFGFEPGWKPGNLNRLENEQFCKPVNWEILEHGPFWLSLELRNTGTRTVLTQFWTEKYWNTNQFDNLWSMTGGRADGRPGRVTETFAKESILGICILNKLNIVYIIESWLFDIFTKKTRAEKWWNLAAVSRRDLSYETNSGPKTKTVETWDLAYYFFIVIFYYSSASVIFFIVIFY